MHINMCAAQSSGTIKFQEFRQRFAQGQDFYNCNAVLNCGKKFTVIHIIPITGCDGISRQGS